MGDDEIYRLLPRRELCDDDSNMHCDNTYQKGEVTEPLPLWAVYLISIYLKIVFRAIAILKLVAWAWIGLTTESTPRPTEGGLA